MRDSRQLPVLYVRVAMAVANRWSRGGVVNLAVKEEEGKIHQKPRVGQELSSILVLFAAIFLLLGHL